METEGRRRFNRKNRRRSYFGCALLVGVFLYWSWLQIQQHDAVDTFFSALLLTIVPWAASCCYVQWSWLHNLLDEAEAWTDYKFRAWAYVLVPAFHAWYLYYTASEQIRLLEMRGVTERSQAYMVEGIVYLLLFAVTPALFRYPPYVEGED